MHNNLIMQREDQWQLHSIVLWNSLNLLGEEVHVAQLIIAVCMYRLVMISIERSKTAPKSAVEIQDNSV